MTVETVNKKKQKIDNRTKCINCMQQEISLHFFFFRSTAPLHYATREGKQDVVKYLLFECGSNPYAKNEDGSSCDSILPFEKKSRFAGNLASQVSILVFWFFKHVDVKITNSTIFNQQFHQIISTQQSCMHERGVSIFVHLILNQNKIGKKTELEEGEE